MMLLYVGKLFAKGCSGSVWLHRLDGLVHWGDVRRHEMLKNTVVIHCTPEGGSHPSTV